MLFNQRKFNRWDVVELESPFVPGQTLIGVVTAVNRGRARFVLEDASTVVYDGSSLFYEKNGLCVTQASVRPIGRNLGELFKDPNAFFYSSAESEGWTFAKELVHYDSKDLQDIFGEYHIPGILNKYNYGQAKKVYDDYKENHSLPDFNFGDKVYAEINGTFYEGVVVRKFEELNCYSVAFEHLDIPQSINAKYLLSEEEYQRTVNTMTF